MNQIELNTIAMNFIEHQSAEVAAKIKDVFHKDAQEKSEQVAGPTLHYIHNIALFDCLVMLNTFFMIEDNSREALQEYLRHAETLRPKFLDIMESLKDFKPTTMNSNSGGDE